VAISQKLELRQSQGLVMMPQLQFAIKLLQLSNLELSQFVEQELERNPLLEREQEGPSGDEAPLAEPATAPLEAPESVAEQAIDADFSNLYTGDSSSDAAGQAGGGNLWSNVRGGRFDDAEDYGVEQAAGHAGSLKEHLLQQLNVATADPATRLIGAHLIESLNEAGYLTESLELMGERLGSTPEDMAAVLRLIQGFDPAGIAARDLAECLALQLAERNRLDPAMQACLDHLELLGKRDLEGLQRLCGVDAEDLAEMIQEIRQLNPKPGLAFEHDVAQVVVPDVYVRESPAGGWSVELNSDTLPRVLVNGRYYSHIARKAKGKEDKVYLQECISSANWLVKSLDQRARTILKVSSEIVRQQDAFLAHGVEHLRPLNLRTIAEVIGMHESTVSRATANKYVATPRGVFELKYFFTSAIASTSGGEAHSAEAVRHRIRKLIDEETGANILSDDRLVELLKAEGVDIARRTVAKYRETMGIASSVQRRRAKLVPA